MAHAALGGAAMGLVVGAKYAGALLAAAAVPTFVLFAMAPAGRLRGRSLPRALGLAALAAPAALAPAWFWYARNLRLTGNPVFPIAVPGLHLPGLFRSIEFNQAKEFELVTARWQWALYPWLEKSTHESGFGAAFVCIAPLGVGILGWRLLRRLRRRRLDAHGFPLVWGTLYVLLWWFVTPHEVRHLLPLIALWGVPALALLEPPRTTPAPLRLAVTVALGISICLSARILLFSPDPDLSVRRARYEALYDVPIAVSHAIPDGALVENRAGRPYNFALLGPRLTWRVRDFAPHWPTETDLAYHGVDFLFFRGSPEAIPPHVPWRLVYDGPAQRGDWWEAERTDRIQLYRVR
jgi:hypothetical protein